MLLVVLLLGGGATVHPTWRGAHGSVVPAVLFVLLFLVLIFLLLQLTGVAL